MTMVVLEVEDLTLALAVVLEQPMKVLMEELILAVALLDKLVVEEVLKN
jgi:hypothetical protein